MANTDRTRKLLVRTALVTSTTIATLVGAQNLAMLDARSFQASDVAPTETPNTVVVVTPEATRTPVTIERAAPNLTILQAAPSITILRQSGQLEAAQDASLQVASVPAIQPPSPSQIPAPDPVVIQPPAQAPLPAQVNIPPPVVVQRQAPAPQRSNSSR